MSDPDDPTVRPGRARPPPVRERPPGSLDSPRPLTEERSELLLQRLAEIEARFARRDEIRQIEADGLREQLGKARAEIARLKRESRQSRADDEELSEGQEELARRVDSIRAGVVLQVKAEVADQIKALAALSGETAGTSAALHQGRKTKGWSAAISTVVAGVVAGALSYAHQSCAAKDEAPKPPTYQPRR